jgi:two-component system cell cycle response regulator DivK
MMLLADRDPDTRALYRESLSFAGWQVIEAEDGREALVLVLTRKPALLVTETRLPYLDGYALCEIVRRDTLTHQMSIVVVTGEADPAELERARVAGADAVLVKPCLPDRLIREVDHLRARSRELRANADRARARLHEQLAKSAALLDRSAEHRTRTLAFTHARFTSTTPPLEPPPLRCPTCDRPLVYERSHIGGVTDRFSEQWDYYACTAGCGAYQYRQRTRALRSIE